jgi:hypothetical protein
MSGRIGPRYGPPPSFCHERPLRKGDGEQSFETAIFRYITRRSRKTLAESVQETDSSAAFATSALTNQHDDDDCPGSCGDAEMRVCSVFYGARVSKIVRQRALFQGNGRLECLARNFFTSSANHSGFSIIGA